jgi:hypothetical protein
MFFDTPHVAGLLGTSRYPARPPRKKKPRSTVGNVDRQVGLFLHSDRHALETRLSTAPLRLGRHEDHQTRGRLADLFGCPAEHVEDTGAGTGEDTQTDTSVGR